MEEETISITVKTFATLRQTLNSSSVQIQLPTSSTIYDALNEISKKFGSNAQSLLFPNGKLDNSFNFLVNQKPIKPTVEQLSEVKLKDGDTLLIIPMVGGG
ncbi:MAG: MoaD/ThiS family protein [Candidatus Heimdallarchaeota archaeon]|nr:MoaD/ThiS family protein [Candidatus Heimdallarchaeota archaeon]MCK5048296.1 MoaD/ThiS family protein [Candidatus Heimdallarchaeota archaeon]